MKQRDRMEGGSKPGAGERRGERERRGQTRGGETDGGEGRQRKVTKKDG